jgi:ribosomal protein S18 acetylase RimI-like enzyme
MPARVKRVTESDREGILEISRHIWDGYDYLPSVINEWLEDPSSYVYGVEADERLVAIANLRLVDGGRTGWMEGLRVHPDFRGKGYAHVLTRELMEKARELGVKRLRYTTSTENEASLKLAEKYGFARVFEMSVFWRPNPNAAPSKADGCLIRQTRPKEVYALLRASPHLVSQKVLIFDWKALDCTLGNLEMIGKSHEFYVSAEEGDVNSLSYGTSRHRGEILLWVFTIYATEAQGFLSHLCHNVAVALERGCSAIMGTCELKYAEAFQNVDWGSEEHWGTNLVLLEKKIRRTT